MRRRSGPSRTRPTTSTSTAPSSEPGAAPQAAARLAARLALPVRDLALLGEALVHSSYPNEHPELPAISNERLEFLGDSVISIVVSEALFRHHPGEDEGRLTARRSAIVSTEGLAALARRVELGDYLLLGQGADRANDHEKHYIVEAIIEGEVVGRGEGRNRREAETAAAAAALRSLDGRRA